ncbi:hypothetical protein FACS1894167_14310 [Synergistales bacterium]|nr:hypothetical protein FACS1894167_14310 [Synergistales bacterium]
MSYKCCQHKGLGAVECWILGKLKNKMSPSCYHAFGKRGKSAREVEDERLSTKIAAVYAANYNCYGVCKIWHALLNEGETAARCTAERLMRRNGLRGVVRGKMKRTAIADRNADFAEDLVKRECNAPAPLRIVRV